MKICYLIAGVSLTLCAQPSPQAVLPPSSPAAISPDTVVASIGGRDLTAGEILKMMEVADPQIGQAFQRDPKYALQQLFLTEYLSAEADKRKLAERSPLKEQIEFLRKRILATAMVNTEQNGYQVPNADMENYYKDNRDRFSQARVKVITISFKAAVEQRGTSAEDLARIARDAFNAAHASRSEDEARKRAAEVLAKLKAGGDFVKLMADYSEDETAPTGADWGTVKPSGSTPAEVKKAVFALKNPGDTTEIVRLPGFFYLVRLEEKTIQPFNDVSSEIILELRNQHLKLWMEGFMKRAEPTIKNVQFFSPRMPAAPPQPSKP